MRESRRQLRIKTTRTEVFCQRTIVFIFTGKRPPFLARAQPHAHTHKKKHLEAGTCPMAMKDRVFLDAGPSSEHATQSG